MLSLVYPPESFFYPYHLIAGIIAGLIYGVIGSVLWYVHSQRILKPSSDTNEKKDEENKQSLGRADAISLGTLILTLIASGLYPFLINPMLDYEISYEQGDNPKIETYTINVKNWGLSPAKNVIFSLTSHNIRFLNFTSEPFLGNLTRLNSSVEGNAFFSIPVLLHVQTL